MKKKYEKIDQLIECLAEDIMRRVEKRADIYPSEINEETKALAELISARASVR